MDLDNHAAYSAGDTPARRTGAKCRRLDHEGYERAAKEVGGLRYFGAAFLAEIPPRVEYELTPFGQKFTSILDAIEELEAEY